MININKQKSNLFNKISELKNAVSGKNINGNKSMPEKPSIEVTNNNNNSSSARSCGACSRKKNT
jgi:hypothetical protein